MKTSFVPHASRVGLFIIILYALCLIWPAVFPYEADVLAQHLLSLKLVFPGFQGFGIGSIIWGGILSFVYGFAGAWICHALHHDCCRSK